MQENSNARELNWTDFTAFLQETTWFKKEDERINSYDFHTWREETRVCTLSVTCVLKLQCLTLYVMATQTQTYLFDAFTPSRAISSLCDNALIRVHIMACILLKYTFSIFFPFFKKYTVDAGGCRWRGHPDRGVIVTSRGGEYALYVLHLCCWFVP